MRDNICLVSVVRKKEKLSTCGVCYHALTQALIYLTVIKKHVNKKSIYFLVDNSLMKSWGTETSSGSVFPQAVGETEKHLGFVFLYYVWILFSVLYATNFYAAAIMTLELKNQTKPNQNTQKTTQPNKKTPQTHLYALIPGSLKFCFQATIQNQYYILPSEF